MVHRASLSIAPSSAPPIRRPPRISLIPSPTRNFLLGNSSAPRPPKVSVRNPDDQTRVRADVMNVIVPLVLSTFGVVFIAELPDKTALASLVLSSRYPARQVVVGAWLAFLVQTAVAVVAGGVLVLLPLQLVHIAAGLSFLAFAVLALRRRSRDRELTKTHT